MAAPTRSQEAMVAYALEVRPELLPFVPELLADLDELGSDVASIVALVASLDLPADARVLDLGCGKGAVALAIAGELGLHVLGIDLFEPFVASCRARAAAAGRAHLCTFRHGDIRELAGELEPAEVAIFAALGDVLGPLEETVAVIRRFVRPGGHLVIDDSYLRGGGAPTFAGFAGYAPRAQTLRRLTACGDVVLRERREPLAAMVAANAANTAAIRRRAVALAERHPELREALLGFAEDQALECDYMEKNLVSASWLIRRT